MTRSYIRFSITILAGLALWLSALCVLAVSAAPAVISLYVDPIGNNGNLCTAPGASACQTIAGALGKASNGDSISVAPAVYHEHLTVGKSVTVTGAGMNSTIIDGSRTDRVVRVTFGSSVVLAALQVRNGSTLTNGGGILNSGSLTLNNVGVLTNTAGGLGGGIYSSNSLLLLHSSVLTNAASIGGGVVNFGPPLAVAYTTISASVIAANHAITDGGGIDSSHNTSLLAGHSQLSVFNSLIDQNVAGHNGAGIYDDGFLSLMASPIQNNRSNDTTGLGGGGGIYINDGSAAITNTSFYNDSTYSGFGGAVYIYSGTLSISGTQISYAGAASGGGLSTGPFASATATNDDFSSDTSFYGGAIENRGALTLTNPSIHQNRAENQGGGILSSGSLRMSGGSVLNNEARGAALGGGGIYLDGGRSTIDGIDLSGNSANYTYTVSGGGLYLAAGSALTLTNSGVDNNTAGYLGAGGGIAAYSSTLKLDSVTLNSNAGGGATLGGGLYLLNVTATLAVVNIAGNTGMYAGGGIYAQSSHFTFTNGIVNNNRASANGGGITAYGSTLDVSASVIADNQAGSDGGGFELQATAANLDGVTISRNEGDRNGGGISHSGQTLTLNNVTLSRNVSDNGGGQGSGGGVYNGSGLLVINNTTLDHNRAFKGGGLFNDRDATSNLTNVTLSADTAITGGGVYNALGFVNPAVITLTNVTLKDNSATDGGGVFNANDALDFIFLKNTLLADSPAGGNCKGKAFTVSNYGLSSDGTCSLIGTGNQTGIPAQLNALADNGGPTLTHLPKPTSPAVNSVALNDCPSIDQRGVSRPQPPSCDIGAVERQPSDPVLSPELYLPIIQR